MPKRSTGVSIRSFRKGDEAEAARLFNEYLAEFVGPVAVTPQSWLRQFRRRSWNGPSIPTDRDCARFAERDGEVVGYAVTDYDPFQVRSTAIVQEVCVSPSEDQYEIFHALVADAEKRARERGKRVLLLQLSPDDGLATREAAEGGFQVPGHDGGVFMTAIVDLARFLGEIEEELTRRLESSELAKWEGVVRLRSGEQEACLLVRGGRASVCAKRRKGDISAAVDPDALPLVLFGQQPVGEAYLQDSLSVTAHDRVEALRLLDALFPRLPMCLPRGQWW